MIHRVLDRLSPLADEVLITTNQKEGFEAIGVPLVADVFPGQGALGGLYTALWAARHPVVMVAACDLPFANPNLMRRQVDLLIENDLDVVIPGTWEHREPLHAVYRKKTCLPAIKKALVQGEKKLVSWFPDVKVQFIPPDEILKYDPLGIAFRNVNSQVELSEVEALARQTD